MNIDILAMLPYVAMGVGRNIIIAIIILTLITFLKIKGKSIGSILSLLQPVIVWSSIVYIVSNILMLLIMYYTFDYIAASKDESIIKIIGIITLSIKWITNLGIIPALAYFGLKNKLINTGVGIDDAKKITNSILIITLISLFLVHWIINIATMST